MSALADDNYSPTPDEMRENVRRLKETFYPKPVKTPLLISPPPSEPAPFGENGLSSIHRYTGNDFAMKAAKGILDGLLDGSATQSSPLYIQSPVGMGKTALLKAICCEAARLFKSPKHVVYATGTSYVSMMKGVDIRNVYLIAIDDISMLDAKSASVFETHIDIASGDGIPVVVSADVNPSRLGDLSARTISRLGAGALYKIEPPLLHERVVLAEEMVHAKGYKFEPGVAGAVARAIHTSIRDLESALNRLHHYQGISGKLLTEQEVKTVLDPFIAAAKRTPSINHVKRVICDHYCMNHTDLISQRRTRYIAGIRQTAIYLCREMTTQSLPVIGRHFGNRDHTTAMHAHRVTIERMDKSEEFALEVAILKEKVVEYAAKNL